MPIAITEAQRLEIDTVGWTIVHDVVSGAELETLRGAIFAAAEAKGKAGTTFSQRNGLAAHPDLTPLVDNERVLELIVDLIGWNIQNRDSIFIHTWPKVPPTRNSGSGDRLLSEEEVAEMEAEGPLLHLGWHFDYEEEFRGVTLDGTMPLLDLKASWFLSDHTGPEHGTTLMVAGSFRWDAEQRATWQQWLDPAAITAVRAPAGSVVLWRPTTLHAVLPHEDPAGPRLAVHVSYGPRWLRQSFVSDGGEQGQTRELLESIKHHPVRQQLLQGFCGDPVELAQTLVGSQNRGQTSGSAASQHWFTDDWETVPLKAWAEARSVCKGITRHLSYHPRCAELRKDQSF